MAKILFIQELEYEFLGPMYLSSMLKQNGHDCGMAIGKRLEDLTDSIETFKPDMVGFSIMSGSHVWAVDMAGKIKKAYGITTIFGGPHPTFFPELIKEESVDMLVRGEGEESLMDVMDHIDIGSSLEEIPNLYLKRPDGTVIKNPLRPLKQDLDAYPFPDRELYNCLKGRIDQGIRCVITSRGCPYSCNFCFQGSFRQLYKGKGRYIRVRKVDKIIEECRQLLEKHDTRTIYFRDDVFGLDKNWMQELLDRYKREIGIEFMCLVRADIVARDEQYASRLADAGCRMVYWGIESGSEEMRNLILNKKLSDEKIVKAANYLHDAGIKFLTFNILGLPGETLEDALSTVSLNIKIKTDFPWCSLFFPLPGTKLTDYALENGYLDKDFLDKIYTKTFYSGSAIKLEDIRDIENLQRFFQTAVLWPWTFQIIKRVIKLKPNPLFKWWFGLIYFYVHLRSEKRQFWPTLKFALRNFKTQLSSGAEE